MANFNVRQRSFYISLFVCILAIGAAGFSTYKSIKDFTDSDKRKTGIYSGYSKKKKSAEEIPKIMELPKKSAPKLPIKSAISNSNEEVKQVSAKVSSDLFVTPIEYIKVSKFNDDLEYSERFRDWRTNDGVDFKGLAGGNVYSIADGKIIEIFEDPSYGHSMRITYKDYDEKSIICSFYDLDKDNIKMKVGDAVKRGQKISSLKNDVLHLTMQKDKKMIDPCKVLKIEQ